MKVHSPYQLTPSKDLSPGNLILNPEGGELSPALVFGQDNGDLGVLNLAGVHRGKCGAVGFSRCLVLSAHAELVLPVQSAGYSPGSGHGQDLQLVIVNGQYFFTSPNVHKSLLFDVNDGGLKNIPSYTSVIAVSGWKIIAEGHDGVFAQG
ncbi:hypothetical protein [Duganella fentianensis]|uniref:hypothetical protein n=1 Tax=Duganella fentianensis TaxID=2692177 RepID=UPI0032B2392A